MTTTTVAPATTKKLEHLPVIAKALARLRVSELIDEVVPPDPRSVVTTGQCVEALVVAILTGTHTLYRVDQLLAGYDLELGLGWTANAGDFHDQRLARALMAIRRAGLNRIVPPVVARAIGEYKLDLEIARLDTTSASIHGAYAGSEPPEFPGDPDAIPHVTKGRSKDRPGLKQIVFGVATTNEGVPLYGRAASGNRSDSNELRHLMRQVAARVPDPRKTTIVGDSKLFSGATILLAHELGFPFVTLVPKTTNARDEAIRQFHASDRKGEVEVLAKKKGKSGEVETWRGCSTAVFYEHEDEVTKDRTRMLLRMVVVESSALAAQKRVTIEKERARERKKLEKELAAERVKSYHCRADADEAAERLAKRELRFHKLAPSVSLEARPVRRARGRPKKGEPRKTMKVWTVTTAIRVDEGAFERALADASCFVLATSHPGAGPRARSNREVFEIYHDQWVVENVMHWFKGDLAFAPVFLKDRERLAALAQVYVIALIVYALIQREARRTLERKGSTIAGNIRLVEKPTTEVIFRLFENVVASRDESGRVSIENLTTTQQHGYRVLGLRVLERDDVLVAPARAPGPGDRGYYRPRPKAARRSRRDE